MKKIEYKAPEMEVIKMNVAKIICGSGSEAPDPSEGLDD